MHLADRCVPVAPDNAVLHKSHLVQAHLQHWGHRIALGFLPPIRPDRADPAAGALALTRNHRCHPIKKLSDDVDAWVAAQTTFYTRELNSSSP